MRWGWLASICELFDSVSLASLNWHLHVLIFKNQCNFYELRLKEFFNSENSDSLLYLSDSNQIINVIF